jgi:hypothetical protein
MVGSREVRILEAEGAGGEEMKTITVSYGSHERSETWEPDTVHCPFCGLQEVWVERDEGDYYQGPSFICRSCGTAFTLPTYRPGSINAQDQQRAEQLK